MIEIYKILNQQKPPHVIVTKTPESTCPAPGRDYHGTHNQTISAAKPTFQGHHHGHKEGDHLSHESHHPNDAEMKDLVKCEETLKMRLAENRDMILEVADKSRNLDRHFVKFYLDCLLSSLDTNDEAMYRYDHQSDKRLVEASESTSVTNQKAAAFVFSIVVELMIPTDSHEKYLRLFAETLADVHHSDHHDSSSRSDYEPARTHYDIHSVHSMSDPKVRALLRGNLS